jgi:methylated-DNA-[protein]-cysteine S-methyltransferase
MQLYYQQIPSEVGKLTLIAHEKALVAILWENEKLNRVKFPSIKEEKNHPVINETKKQLKEYFKRQRKSFDIPMDPQGTEFQKEVWEALKEIPYGTTLSYGQIAKNIGRPNASRAVGGAIGKNPISIFIPCHRVIGSNGKLTGFAGGISTKATLLKIEGHL